MISWEMLGFRSTAESTSGSSLSDELSVSSRIGQMQMNRNLLLIYHRIGTASLQVKSSRSSPRMSP